METFDQWSAEAQRIDVGGLSLAVHDVGEGPVATFLHGYPSSSLDAIPLIDRLDGVRVVAPDLPGFGASDKPVGHPYSIHGAVDAVESIWDRLGITSSVLVAHDYSVSVAQELLARSEEHTSELQSRGHLVCRLLLEKKKTQDNIGAPTAKHLSSDPAKT